MTDRGRPAELQDGSLIATSAPALPWPDEPEVEPIHVRFERIALRSPAAEAVLGSGGLGHTTYRELNEHANGVAAQLIERLEAGGHRVAVLGDDTSFHLAAVMGILKAGMTAVPLHEVNPDGRLEFVVNHSQSSAIVASGEATARAEAIGAAAGAAPVISRAAPIAANPEIDVDVDSMARIMYTSGSTGAPKGVIHSHRHLFRRGRNESQFYRYGSDDRLSQLFAASFAASTSHTFGALLNGAAMVPYDLTAHGIHHVADWLDAQEISGLAMVPTLFRRFLQHVARGRVFDSVRYVMIGAEVALRGDVELFAEHFSESCRLIHQLGATEAGRIAHYVMKDASGLTDAIVPAGFPVLDKELLLLEDGMNPVPNGEVGELFVRSSNLAEGYWGDPELNAEKFFPDPEGSARRLYRTGDLARLLADGALQYLGRRDNAIKIRGYSVDLQEIEHALLDGPGVAEGTVVAPAVHEGERRIVAYFVPNEQFSEPALRTHFARHVPAYMVPTAFVALPDLPLTSRGKVDRAALEQRDLTEKERPISPPESELEVGLAAIWSRVLGVDRIGLDDEFFRMGGDSIQAYELIAAVYHELGVDLPASTLLSASTVRTQAALIESGSGRSARSLVPFRETGSKEPFFCVHGIGGGVMFLSKLLPFLAADRPIYGLQPEIMEAEDVSYLTVSEMASEYIAEIRTIQPTGPYFIGGTCFGGLIAQEMGRLLEAADETVASLVLIDPPAPGYDRPEITRWQATKKQVKRVLFARRRKRVLAEKQERWDRTQHLRELHAQAAKDYRPQPSGVPLHVLGAKATTPRHEWMWGATASGHIIIEEFPASHGEMYEPRNNPRIAEMLNRHWSDVAGDKGDQEHADTAS